MATPVVAKMEMQADLESFLRKYVLIVPNDNAMANSGVAHGYFFEVVDQGANRPGKVLGVLSRPFHRTQAFTILLNDPNFMLHGGAIAPGTRGYKYHERLPAHYIAITRDSNQQGLAVAPSWYTLAPTAQIMITPRLTGCTFIIRTHGAVTEVAHIIPRQGETGQDLEDRRRREASYKAPGAPAYQQYVYGRDRYGHDRDVTIVGYLIHGSWFIYAQKHDLHSYQVRSVHRIFP